MTETETWDRTQLGSIPKDDIYLAENTLVIFFKVSQVDSPHPDVSCQGGAATVARKKLAWSLNPLKPKHL